MQDKSEKQIEKDLKKRSSEELEILAYNLVTKLEQKNTNKQVELLELWIRILKKVIDEKTKSLTTYNSKLYPYINDPNFNLKIFEKTEFNQHKIVLDPKKIDEIMIDSCNPDKFNLLPTQMFLKSFDC